MTLVELLESKGLRETLQPGALFTIGGLFTGVVGVQLIAKKLYEKDGYVVCMVYYMDIPMAMLYISVVTGSYSVERGMLT